MRSSCTQFEVATAPQCRVSYKIFILFHCPLDGKQFIHTFFENLFVFKALLKGVDLCFQSELVPVLVIGTNAVTGNFGGVDRQCVGVASFK